ncbi:MAG: hypothetical protein K1X74_04525 [Pirellulales bacterium]|nr:hypothetical protein [Pirellulales bacterium]
MGFLKKFFRSVFRDGAPQVQASSFERLSEEELEAHLGVVRYGDFFLTDAVRPSYDLQVVPQAGYRHDVYHDDENHSSVPVLMAAASREQLFELFIDLLEPLGCEVDVVLETSHNREQRGHVDLYREHIDMPVLKSILYDYEELLLNDGCTGIAVLNPHLPLEIQFDEHKLLIMYGQDLTAFEDVLERHGIPCCDQIKFITEAEHVHSSSDQFQEEFEEFKTRLGMDAPQYRSHSAGDSESFSAW